MEDTDKELLQRYIASQSEKAFETLVERYVNLVHSAALRQTADATLAQDVTQAVFIILARKAPSLSREVNLAGWLYRTTAFTASKVVRSETRRRRREQESLEMQRPEGDPQWEQLMPVLDVALQQLNDRDRDAVILRYFQNKNMTQVGQALHISQEAAQKCVNRAVEKLRVVLTRRSITVSTVVLTGLLSSHAIQAAPSQIAGAVKAATLGSSATFGVVEATLRQLFWAQLKPAAIGIAALSVVIVSLSFSGHNTPAEHSAKEQSQPTPNPTRFTTKAGTTGDSQIQPTDSAVWQPRTLVTSVVPTTPVTLPASTPPGLPVITMKLAGTEGLPFEVAYSAEGQPHSVIKGVIPSDVVFRADAFTASVALTRAGLFGFEIFRDELLMASGKPTQTNPQVVHVQGRKGGRGVEVTTQGRGGP